ncbi:MAG: hypothetical protein Q7P63_06035 [Verrucomicrobiota bacterium JB022]|nr:hypothetical protein [Verrucomicrobiota bacterium JB022]
MNPILFSTLTYAAEKVVDGIASIGSSSRKADAAEFARLLEAQQASQPESPLARLLADEGVQSVEDLQNLIDRLMAQLRAAFLQSGASGDGSNLTLSPPNAPGGSWSLTDGQHSLELTSGSALAAQADQWQELQALAAQWEQNPALSRQEVLKTVDIHA